MGMVGTKVNDHYRQSVDTQQRCKRSFTVLSVYPVLQGMEELESCHKNQQATMTDEVKQEMASFQKKVLKETVSKVLGRCVCVCVLSPPWESNAVI